MPSLVNLVNKTNQILGDSQDPVIVNLGQGSTETQTPVNRYNVNDQEYELAVNLRGHVCPINTTSIPLGTGAVFTGNWQDTLDYGVIQVGVFADKASATNGLVMQYSANGTDIDDTDTFTIKANIGKTFSFQPARRYIRVIYTNGAQAQTKFRLETTLRRVYVKPSSHRINDSIVAEDDAELVKAVLTGENPAGTFVNFQATTAGNFKVSLEEVESGISDDSNSKLKVSSYTIDEFGEVGRVLGDSIFRGVALTIPVEHHEIHCGDSYEATYTAELGNAASAVFAIIVPNENLTETFPGDDQTAKQYHAKIMIDSESELLITMFEAATLSANGTAITIFNRNRNYQLTDFLGLYRAPTITANGTQVYQRRIGSGRSFGGAYGRENEWILKDNTIYLVKLVNQVTTANWYNFEIDYYVHPGV